MATVAEFISVLRNSSTQAHIYHNQTQVFSEHEALGGYYEEVLDFVDNLTETYSALYGIVVGYKAVPYKDYVSKDETLVYFKGLYQYIQTNRTVFTDSFLQNIVDEISQLIAQTIFRLNLNKI
jgi:hypothetical protein